MMARAGNGVAATTAADAASIDGRTCYAILVKNRSASTGDLRINVPSIHGDDYGVPLEPGESQIYRCPVSFATFNHKTDSDTATFDWEVIDGADDQAYS
jgi:hypothetical protein